MLTWRSFDMIQSLRKAMKWTFWAHCFVNESFEHCSKTLKTCICQLCTSVTPPAFTNNCNLQQAEWMSFSFCLSVQAPPEQDQVWKDYFRYHASKARSQTYINTREVSGRFTLPPGKYLLLPTTFQPHHEADFLVRIFSEKKATAQWVLNPGFSLNFMDKSQTAN